MFLEIELVDLTTPLQGAEVITDSYWHVKDNKVLVWIKGNRFKPQCNKQKSIMDFFSKKKIYKNYDVVKIPVAYIFERADFYKDKVTAR
jgi:hypothetical protein